MLPFMLFRKLLSPPPLRSDRMAVYVKQDGGLYAADGATGIERRVMMMTSMWPVGSVFFTVQTTNPASLLGFGTWVRFGEGRTLVGQNSGDVDFDTAEEVGGEKTVTLTTAQLPVHNHTQDAHNHTQDAHNHTQDAHNHTQDPHQHSSEPNIVSVNAGSFAILKRTNPIQGLSTASSSATSFNTATNQATTATNQATTATNQATTATNQNTGGGQAHNNVPPYIVVYTWKRTA